MQELLKSFIVRPAEKLTKKQADAIGINSHPILLQSNRFLSWINLCKQEKFQELQTQMKTFLESTEIINSFDKFPNSVKSLFVFADYHGYEFDLKDFINEHKEFINKESVDSKKVKNDRWNSDLKNVYTNIADQILAESFVKDFKGKKNNQYFDKQAILKTIHLIEILTTQRLENSDFIVRRIYEKPILLPQEFYEIDWCLIKRVSIIPSLNTSDGKGNRNLTEVKESEIKAVQVSGKNESLIKDDSVEDLCNCNCDETCVEQNPCCAKIVTYVADLYVVKEVVRGYEVSEMSYIENVMKDEIRERVNRNFEREEIETQHEEEQTSFEQHDHQVDEKFSLQKEIEKQIEQSISVDAGVTAHQKWGTGDVTATTNFGFNQSKKDAQKTVQNNAKEVIDKSVTSLQKKVRDLTIRKVIKEIEETNKHTFGGQTGASEHMSQQFYYVNQVKKAQVYSWGKRQLIDLYLPEPSELYKKLVEKRFDRKKPEFPFSKIEDINPDKYLEYIIEYNLSDVESPPLYRKSENIKLEGHSGSDGNIGAGNYHLSGIFNVPENYMADTMEASEIKINNVLNQAVLMSFSLYLSGHNNLIFSDSINTSFIPPFQLPPLEGTQSVVALIKSLHKGFFSMDLRISYKLKSEFITKWQIYMYEKIKVSYEKELAEYNTALTEFEKNKQSIYSQNPFILLQDIQEQLKQAAISYISCQFFDDMNAMKGNVKPCGFPQFDIREAQKEGDFVRFFEQAFEWKFMNFIFYPYFWSRKCTWEKKMKEQADNMLFQRFLKAGFARVSIPVRQGFEGHVNWYLKTRQIWSNVGAPATPGTDFLPIIQEIKEDKENFNTEREGLLKVTEGDPIAKLINSDYYWNIGNPTAIPPILPHVDLDRIEADLNREVFIDCVQYKIMSISEDTSDTTHKTWNFILERPFEGDKSLPNDTYTFPWSTGSVFIGAPWEFRVPTKLVWMRTSGNDLPKQYPVE